MKNEEQFPEQFRQNEKLPIRIVSPGFGHLSPEIIGDYNLTQRKSYYFFLFMIEGNTRHGVDLEEFEVNSNDLLFVLPHQLHQLPDTNHGTDYFKIGLPFKRICVAVRISLWLTKI